MQDGSMRIDCLIKRDMRFVPERHRITRAGMVRLVAIFSVSAISLCGLVVASIEGWRALTSTEVAEMITMEPDRTDWKRRPETPGGRIFVNQGLEINRVQAELFDLPHPDKIILAPPPSDF
tara:strand:- start:339 stop:701 length:363 start_codon:yes stop_codon:yes gene_type:complete